MCFMQWDIKFTEGLAQMTWFLLLLWFDVTHRQTHIGHTGTNRLTHTHKYIITLPAMYKQQQLVLQWINNLQIQTFILQRSTMSFLLKIIHQNKLFTRINDSTRINPSCEIQRILIEMVPMSKTHTQYTQRQR